MILHSALPPLFVPSSTITTAATSSSHRPSSSPILSSHNVTIKTQKQQQLCTVKLCSCCRGRRHFLEAATAPALFPVSPPAASNSNSDDTAAASNSNSDDTAAASNLNSDATAMLNQIHPPRPDWYEELYASALNSFTKPYEAEVAGFKTQIFSNLKGKAKKVVEIGIGTGPNLKYYAGDTDLQLFGLDPNRKMEKYAQAAAVAAGLRPSNFNFIHAVGEAIPFSDASVDAVIGTLVLCSVKDVDMALKEVIRVLRPGGLYLFVEHVAAKDGTTLKFWQSVLDPLQQTVAGCHLTRETGRKISEAGFSDVELNTTFVSNAFLENPHVYGVACK